MRLRTIRIRAKIAGALLVLFLLPCVARATDDETAMGLYSYSGHGLRLHFILDLDGVRDLRINGRRFKGPIQLDEDNYAGSMHTYAFHVTDRGVTKTVSLAVLFDSGDADRGAIGFYYEFKKPLENMTWAVTFQPAFRRILSENLPSAKVSQPDGN